MDSEDRQQDYLAKAKLAEEHARLATDSVMRNTWLRLAEGYRQLAVFVQTKSSKGLSWGQSKAPRSPIPLTKRI